jgi:hydrogenase small subunit
MSLLCAEDPDLLDLLGNYDVDLLWHPSLSAASPHELGDTIDRIVTGEQELTVLCLEGSLLLGPEGSGYFDTFLGKPKKDVVRQLADKAHVVLAVGTCAAFGGIPAAPPNPTDATGLQYLKEAPGGFLGEDWTAASGLPVINLSGCPVHPSTIVQTLQALLLGLPLELDELHRPRLFYSSVVHQGCTRNEYHEYDVEDDTFGGKGCLFYNLGCQGPITMGTCNIELWNGRSSKTRVGVPCFGCTAPSFPQSVNPFQTDKIGDVPVVLPLGVDRANYLAYKGLAKAATPRRLRDRDNDL